MIFEVPQEILASSKTLGDRKLMLKSEVAALIRKCNNLQETALCKILEIHGLPVKAREVLSLAVYQIASILEVPVRRNSLRRT